MNKKKNKNLIISFLLLVLLIGFNGLMVVSGATNTAQAGHGTSTSGSGGCKVGSTSGPKFTTSNANFGIRLALVDKNGNLIGKIMDVWDSNSFKNTNYQIYVTNGSQRLKKDVTLYNGTDDPYATSMNDLISKWDGHIAWISTVETWFGDAFSSLTSGLKGANGFSGYAAAIRALSDKWESAKDDPERLKKIEQGIKGFFGLAADYKIDYENTYLQLEPLMTYETRYCNGTTGKVSQNRYTYGSVTELHQRQTAHGVSSWGTKPWKEIYAHFGVGVYIDVSGLSEEEKSHAKPDIYSSSTENNPSFDSFSSAPSTNAWGVSHVWLGIMSSGNCADAVDYINRTYTVGTTEYKNAVEAVRGLNDFEYINNDGEKVVLTGAQPFDFLKEENYSKADYYDNQARCENYHTVDCPTAINYINNWGTGSVPGLDTPEYHADVKQVKDGTFVYWATDMTKDEAGEYNYYYFKMDRPYSDFTGLDPDTYGSGPAWCGEGDSIELTCEAALKYIHENPSKYGSTGSSTYHDTIASVKNGTFSYTDESNPENKIVYKVPSAGFTFGNLLQANYKNAEASCDDPSEACGQPAKIKVDPCTSGVNYYMDSSDKENWLVCGTAYMVGETMYTSENTGHVATTDENGGVVGNSEYCRLFCYEEVLTSFPTAVTEVKAGRTFGWGQSGYGDDSRYGSIRITKECSNRERTDSEGLEGEGYLYKKWENEYKSNEKTLIEGWIKKGAAEEAKDNISVSTGSCCYWYTTCYTSKGRPYTCCGLYGYTSTARADQSLTNPADGSNNWPEATTQGASTSKRSSCYLNSSVAYTEAYNAAKSDLESQASSGQSTYTSAKNKEPKLLEKIRQCTNNIKYVYKTVVTFSFDEPTNRAYGSNDRMFSNHDPLEVEPSDGAEGYNTNNVNTSSCTTKTVYTYTCSGSKASSKCTAVPTQVLDCTQVTWKIEGEWEYNYKASVFEWYSLKTNNKLMNGENKTGEDDVYFYSLGYGLPTAFTLTSGEYDMSVIVTGLGDYGEITDAEDADYNITDGHFGPTADTYAEGKGFEYACTYEVDNDIFGYDCKYSNGKLTSDSPAYCDPTKDPDPNGELIGIDIAYRLVGLLGDGDDLSKAFPGQYGLGRNPNYNWNLVKDEIPEILRSDIYEQDRYGRPNLAMYEIFMDLKTIQSIRADNQRFSGDEYTSFDNVKCAGQNQKYCASDFLSDLYNGYYGEKLYGTCLTVADTQSRAEDVLANGCYGTYTFPTINWVR